MSNMWQISVPGSTANLGSGFDSIGLGLSLYLKLTVSLQDSWEIIHLDDNGPKEFELEEHLLYVIAKKIADQYGKQLPACRVEMASELPLARGLGSSAAVIVAGIELVNQVCDLGLTVQDKLDLSSQIEGHPDNATASVLGGLTISSMDENGVVDTFHVNDIEASFVVYVPDVELKTSEARSVLPEQFDRAYAVRASANANMLAASLMVRNYEHAGRYMEADLFHEPFRAQLIPQYKEIRASAKANGAFGTALSGAGPTMISIIPTAIAHNFVNAMKNQFPEHQIILTKADEHGVQVKFKRLLQK
ncbi:homoserine kinase [Lysinibacillus sp. KCTC 33748]|uniref:homoserine kinase n=1 Tax=unclassified Lysinibacillus TaxID=2636778 RepID=UPI0009A8973E|nr:MULTISPECIES: homoserine kinase [unclassified Lysinibacillus]OXS72313.1 homoserine kinase [Lysinibacillus sp. KCTC 33748]SKB96376.1 homoserine kinase [Lysinibacillus sp. AC-3]